MMLFPEPPRSRSQAISPSTSPGSAMSAPDFGSPPRTAYNTPAHPPPGQGGATRFPSGPLPILDKDSKSLSFVQDFILLSEFSEQEGPIPLHVIPSGAQGSFNLNEFVLRIMAVDYQSKNTFAETGVLPDDTQFILSEREENCHAYVHHFTLHDFYARGYVRPFALSYVTTDRSKIMSYFDHLVRAFCKVTAQWKMENRRVFLNDLRMRVADLHFTRKLLQEEAAKQATEADSDAPEPPPPTPGSMTVDAVEDILQEMDEALTRISVKSGEIVLDPNYQDDIALCDQQSLDLLEPYRPKRLKSLDKRNFNRRLRTVPDLTCIDAAELSRRLKHIQRRFRRSCLALRVESYESAFSEPQSSLLTTGPSLLLNFNPTADRPSRDIEPALSGWLSSTYPHGENPLFSLDHEDTDNDSDSSDSGYDYSASSSVASYQDALEDFASEHGELDYHRPKADSSGSFHIAGTSAGNHSHMTGHHAADGMGPDHRYSLEDSLSSLNRRFNTMIGSPHATAGTDFTESVIGGFDSKPPLRSFLHHTEFYRRSHIGRGILHFRDNVSFTRHLLYALLKGRTVVIYGAPASERGVRSLVATLSLFVLGTNYRSRIRKWMTRPLTLSALSKLKLVGMSKQTPIPKQLEQYVSIFDFESESCLTPIYQGSLVDDLLGPKTRWPDEVAFIAHLHHQLLEMACKAFQVYHLCHIGVVPEAAGPTTDVYPQKWELDSEAFVQQAVCLPGHHVPSARNRSNTGTSSSAQTGSSSGKAYNVATVGSGQVRPPAGSDIPARGEASESNKPWDVNTRPPYKENPFDVLARLGVKDTCDVDILQYMCEVVMQQQEEALRNSGVLPRLANPPIRLDTGAPVLLRNVKVARTPRLGSGTLGARRASATTNITIQSDATS